jgi:integrase
MAPSQSKVLDPSFTTDAGKANLLREMTIAYESSLEPGSRRNVNSTIKTYSAVCNQLSVPAFPCSWLSVGLFFTAYCRVNKASNLPNLLSHLKRFSAENGLPWLSEYDAFRVSQTRRGLEKLDRRPVKRKNPITGHILKQFTTAMNVSALPDLQFLTMAWLAHDGLLRASELCALRVRDVYWAPTAQPIATIYIHASKANKTGEAERVPIRPYGMISAAVVLRAYFNAMGFDSSCLDAPLFPALQPVIDDCWGVRYTASDVAVSKETFRALTREAISLIGLENPSDYSGHSYRSGGATDLWDGACRPRLIQLQGRWKSDAFKLYIRDNIDQRAAEVCAAFASLEQGDLDSVLLALELEASVEAYE